MHKQFFEAIKTAEKVALGKFKIGLLLNPIYMGFWLPKDKHREDKQDSQFIVTQGNFDFEIWKRMCLKQQSLTEEEFIELFPAAAGKIEWWK